MIGTEKSGRAIITIKLDIIPGHYMNKEHFERLPGI